MTVPRYMRGCRALTSDPRSHAVILPACTLHLLPEPLVSQPAGNRSPWEHYLHHAPYAIHAGAHCKCKFIASVVLHKTCTRIMNFCLPSRLGRIKKFCQHCRLLNVNYVQLGGLTRLCHPFRCHFFSCTNFQRVAHSTASY